MTSEKTEQPDIEHTELQSAEDKMRRALGLDGGGHGRFPDKSSSRGERTLQISPSQVSSNGPGERRKHRFAQDGDIQFSVVTRRAAPGGNMPQGNVPHPTPMRGGGNNTGIDNSPTSPLQIAEASLRNERVARERMERLLREAQGKIHDLQTNIGHAVIARTEASEAAVAQKAVIDGLTAEMEALRAQLAEITAARDAAVHAREDVAAELAVVRREAERQATVRQVPVAEAVRPAPASAESVRSLPVAARKARAPGKPRAAKEPQPVKWWIKSKPKVKTT